jgi:hypothetical protein
VDDGRRLASLLGPRASKELLAILLRPTEDRVNLIGRLYAEEGSARQLAEMLIDIESSSAVDRGEVIDALRAIVPSEEQPEA